MLCKPHYEKMLAKLQRFEQTLNPYLFDQVMSLDASGFVADKQYHSIPSDDMFQPVSSGWKWGGEGAYCWLRTSLVVPDDLDGKDLFIMPKMGGYEAMLWVNGEPFGTFNTKIVYTSHGNHYCGLVKKNAKAGECIDIAIEYYAGHDYHGCDPFSDQTNTYQFDYEGLYICTKNEKINKFYFDLVIANQLANDLPDESFMKGYAINALCEVHNVLLYSPYDTTRDEFMSAIDMAQPFLTELLSKKNSDSAPTIGLIGHSHMDTAWLWHVGETIKKCARTYSNQISLMEQYPEHKFVQSSSCHSNMIREYYPSLFKRIQDKVAEGRYEPNGAVWVECDCNITGGEAMIRQFLWGQRFTEKYFNYRSNAFWLPDTFGYSASIPQIMKGCGVDYFLTTKINWNDTNAFPYNTFYWQGIDGTKVFSHFNTTHSWQNVKELRANLLDDINVKSQPTVTNKRLVAYGYGDGGGGPQFEMLETGRRCVDLYDVPKTYSTTVSDFMQDLESTVVNPNTYKGELYLELHRGTLTNQHEIKHNNRKAEIALRNLEYLTVNEAIKNNTSCSTQDSNKLYSVLLINQFHDILPGTCINAAHEQCKSEMRQLISDANNQIKSIVDNDDNSVSFINTLSFDRCDAVFLDDNDKAIANVPQQTYVDINGNKKRIVCDVSVPAFSSVTLEYGSEKVAKSPFSYDGNVLKTPFANITFDDNGFITSFIDKTADRELVDGMPFNTFLMAEDVSMSWDNWDIDADLEMKFRPCATLISREVVSDGAVAFIVRSKYFISAKSIITQDMIFFSNSPEVRFDTYMDWQDDHRFLKTAFDTNVCEDFARNEIQFGYCKRPTTRNNSVEQAKFEVVNHKYTDLSEIGYGVAILNDSKYGISVNGSNMHLSLHKGGTRPDVKGDHGCHHTVYSFLPHNCGYNADVVVQPAYMLNIPVIVSNGSYNASSLMSVDKSNIIVEAIKPCEDEDKAFIARVYECVGTRTNCCIKLNGAKSFVFTNMLEEQLADVQQGSELSCEFKPFEIKTIKIYY